MRLFLALFLSIATLAPQFANGCCAGCDSIFTDTREQKDETGIKDAMSEMPCHQSDLAQQMSSSCACCELESCSTQSSLFEPTVLFSPRFTGATLELKYLAIMPFDLDGLILNASRSRDGPPLGLIDPFLHPKNWQAQFSVYRI